MKERNISIAPTKNKSKKFCKNKSKDENEEIEQSIFTNNENSTTSPTHHHHLQQSSEPPNINNTSHQQSVSTLNYQHHQYLYQLPHVPPQLTSSITHLPQTSNNDDNTSSQAPLNHHLNQHHQQSNSTSSVNHTPLYQTTEIPNAHQHHQHQQQSQYFHPDDLRGWNLSTLNELSSYTTAPTIFGMSTNRHLITQSHHSPQPISSRNEPSRQILQSHINTNPAHSASSSRQFLLSNNSIPSNIHPTISYAVSNNSSSTKITGITRLMNLQDNLPSRNLLH